MVEDAPGREVAVLVSGGMDSAILCVDLLGSCARVVPIYVRFGLRWEEVELGFLRRFLEAVARPRIEPLVVLAEPVADVYGPHWSVAGAKVPGAESPDEAVYLPGRNLLLVAKTAVWCRLRGIEAIALGCLRANPFPDSTAEFYEGLEGVVNLALGGRLRIVRPYERLRKAEVLSKGVEAHLPLQYTFSCLSPAGGLHCGGCNKCAERRNGFDQAGVPDPTVYARASAMAR